jgi:hypothetical protein
LDIFSICGLGYIAIAILTYKVVSTMLHQVKKAEKRSFGYKMGIYIVSVFWPLLWIPVGVFIGTMSLRNLLRNIIDD